MIPGGGADLVDDATIRVTQVGGPPTDGFDDDPLAGFGDAGGGDEGFGEPLVAGTDELTGPSWQDASSVEVAPGIEPEGQGPDERDVPAAFLTGAALVIVALVGLVIGKAVFAFIAGAILLVGQGELYGVMVKRGKAPGTAIGLVAGALTLLGAYLHGEAAAMSMFALGVVGIFLWFMVVPPAQRTDAVGNIGITIANLAWIPLMGSFLLVMLALGGDGTGLVVSVIALTFIFDTTAFLVGSVWGNHLFPRPLAPTVSPKKSIEGVIAGTIVTALVSATLISSFVDAFSSRRFGALLLGLVIAAAATMGDLAESLVKRDLGVKDMSSVLPGHGGVLDRIDSLLFVAPISYVFLRIILS